LQDRAPEAPDHPETWKVPVGTWTASSLREGLNRSAEGRDAALRTIRSSQADWVIYTDGSASEGTSNGGSGLIVTTGDPEVPDTIYSETIRGRLLTSSYEEEREAMLAAVAWLQDNATDPTKALICTDSQSLVEAITNLSPDSRLIREHLDGTRGQTTIQWIPGHCDIPGNEMADKLANEAARSSDAPAKPTSKRTAISVIKRTIADAKPQHARTAAVYENYSEKLDVKVISTRKDAAMLARIRSGHSMLFGAYRALMDPTQDPACPRCKEDYDTVEHWLLECPGTEAARMTIFGDRAVQLGILTGDPAGAIALSKSPPWRSYHIQQQQQQQQQQQR
jgi:ribonuclease HI